MPWLHPPEPLGAGGCTLACTARRPGPAASWSECSRGVYAMAAHRLAQVPASRSAATRRHRSERGAPWHALIPEGARARARPGSAGTGASTDRHDHARRRPVQLSCVTTATASLWVRHRRTAQPSACLIPSQVSPTVGIATKSPLCIHTSTHFSASFRQRLLDPPASPLRPASFAVTGARRAPHAAVRRRPGADRYSSADPPRQPARPRTLSRPTGFPGFPGFSQVSQGSPRFLTRCTYRYVNAVTQINFSK